MIYHSLLQSLQGICILVTFAYLLGRKDMFRRLMGPSINRRDRVWTFVFFSILALVEILLNADELTASSRVVAVTVAGLLGGPIVGLALGILVSLMSAIVLGPGMVHSGLATAVGGLLGGWVAHYRPQLQTKVLAGFIVGALGQTLWLGLVSAKDTLVATWDAAALLYMPSIVLNAGGVALFLMIMGDMRSHQERLERTEVARALRVANRILPHMKYGLDTESAGHIAGIVQRMTGTAEVTISNSERTLARCGANGRQQVVNPGVSDLAARSMEVGHTECVGHNRRSVRLGDVRAVSGCATPLFYADTVIGCVEMYEDEDRRLRPEVVELGQEIAQFLSSYQMQLADLERRSEIASKAELRALEAQVHPHFLFNALNTLAYLCESDPGKASRIAIQLGAYYRTALHRDMPVLIPLKDELANVRRYLDIEQARFGDRLSVVIEVSDGLGQTPIPVLSLQPLAENAVLHGLSKKAGQGVLRIRIRTRRNRLQCWVMDNGNGIGRSTPRAKLLEDRDPHGLNILRNRLERLYSGHGKLRIRSHINKGTTVLMSVPIGEDSVLP